MSKAVVSLILCAIGLVASWWLAQRIVRPHRGETTETFVTRLARRCVAAVGAVITTQLIMVWWLTSYISANCNNQQEFQAFFEGVLIADVRIARAEYSVAVDQLQALEARRRGRTLPDTSRLSPEIQDFINAAVEDSNTRADAELARVSSAVTAFRQELATREGDLDKAREQRFSCPDL